MPQRRGPAAAKAGQRVIPPGCWLRRPFFLPSRGPPRAHGRPSWAQRPRSGGRRRWFPGEPEAHAASPRRPWNCSDHGLPQGVTDAQAEQTVKRGQSLLRDFVKGSTHRPAPASSGQRRRAAHRGRRKAALRMVGIGGHGGVEPGHAVGGGAGPRADCGDARQQTSNLRWVWTRTATSAEQWFFWLRWVWCFETGTLVVTVGEWREKVGATPWRGFGGGRSFVKSARPPAALQRCWGKPRSTPRWMGSGQRPMTTLGLV